MNENLPVPQKNKFITKLKKMLFVVLSSVGLAGNMTTPVEASEYDTIKVHELDEKNDFKENLKVASESEQIVNQLIENRKEKGLGEYSQITGEADRVKEQLVALFEGIDNFYEALDELMDYVQHPYFTDENVEKEKGIIGQEIMMYDDYPEWKVYLNALEAMYHEHPVKLDITGTIETISHIDKDVLYKCYNTFYNPSNMVMVACGDFLPEDLLEEIKKRLVKKEANG